MRHTQIVFRFESMDRAFAFAKVLMDAGIGQQRIEATNGDVLIITDTRALGNLEVVKQLNKILYGTDAPEALRPIANMARAVLDGDMQQAQPLARAVLGGVA